MATRARSTFAVEDVPVDELVLLEGNPRSGTVEAVAASLERFGQRKPLVVRRSDRVVLAGNHTLLGARRLGWSTVAVHHVDDDEATGRAFALADNRSAEVGVPLEALLAVYDGDALAAMIAEVRAADEALLAATGWGEDDLLELLELIGPGSDGPDPDAVPEPPAKPTARLGDVWQLGEHRVACGSALDRELVDRLLAGDEPAMVWTDPPYNVDYEGRAGSIENDALSDDAFEALIYGALEVAAAVVRKGGAVYVAHADSQRAVFTAAFLAAGLKLSGVLIWLKQAATLGRSDYQWRHEPILYGWRPGARHRWYGGRKQTTFAGAAAGLGAVEQPDGSWAIQVGDRIAVVSGADLNVDVRDTSVHEYPKPPRSDLHPTTKPTALVERHLLNSSRAGDVVLDLFGGSGTTLIAAERQMRAARLVELDPVFVDVICRRWADYSGGTPVRLEAAS